MEFIWLLGVVITAVFIAAIALRMQLAEEEHDEELAVEKHLKAQRKSLKTAIKKKVVRKRKVATKRAKA